MISDSSPQFLILLGGMSLPLLGLLLFKSLRPAAGASRLTSFLFLLLYANLLAGLFMRLETSRAFTGVSFMLLAAGLALFYGELLIAFLSRAAVPNSIQEIKRRRGPWHEVIQACQLISEAKMGALMILERKKPLDAWAAKGVALDAKVTRELLVSIFTPPGALHDGASILRDGKILCAGVIVPLSKNPDLSKELGTRHRAAIGFSEITDALCVIISEETGAVSLADKGKLFYDIPFDKLGGVLERALRFKLDRAKSAALYTEPAKAGV